MPKAPFRHTKKWHATGYALADGKRVVFQERRDTFERYIVVEDDDGVGIAFTPNRVQQLINQLLAAREEATRRAAKREEVNSMKNHEEPKDETSKPADQGSAEGAGQTEGGEKTGSEKPAPEGD